MPKVSQQLQEAPRSSLRIAAKKTKADGAMNSKATKGKALPTTKTLKNPSKSSAGRGRGRGLPATTPMPTPSGSAKVAMAEAYQEPHCRICFIYGCCRSSI